MKWLIVSSMYSIFYIALSILTFLGLLSLPSFLFLFFIPLIVAIIIKIIKECREYGRKSVLKLSFQGTPKDRKDVFLKSLESQINSQVFISKRDPKMLVIINTNGIYLYSFIQEEGVLLEKENVWYLKNGRDIKEIKNPLIELKNEKKRLEEKLNMIVSAHVVLDSYTYFQKGSKKYTLLQVGNAPFYLCKTDIKNQLSNQDIEKAINIVVLKLSYTKAFEKLEDDL